MESGTHRLYRKHAKFEILQPVSLPLEIRHHFFRLCRRSLLRFVMRQIV